MKKDNGANEFAIAARNHIESTRPGNAAFVLIKGGEVFAEHFVSVGRQINRDTLFQVASISKWVTAWGVMALAGSGHLHLDLPVSRYLTRWSLPASKFNNDGVTIRRLLSHTAGLIDGLGYGGFETISELQTLEQSLTRAADALAGNDGAVIVGAEPGKDWHYSGGGYTLLQLIIEEVSNLPFEEFMQKTVLQPLDMLRSTFRPPAACEQNLAEFYDTDGTIAPHYLFTVTAAAALYTSVSDLTRFLQAHLKGRDGTKPGRGVLASELVEAMRKPESYRFIIPHWGLGPSLTAKNNGGGMIIGHRGFNRPSINTSAHLDPATGNGIVVFETGHPSLAEDLVEGWIYWQTANGTSF